MKRMTVIVTLLGMAISARGEFAMPSDAPVERLVKNATAYVEEHPGDAQGYYVLGRIHYLAWSIRTGMVPVWGHREKEGELPAVAAESFVGGSVNRLRWAEAERRAKQEFHTAEAGQLPKEQGRAYGKRVREIWEQLQKEKWVPEPVADEILDRHASEAVTNFEKAIALKANDGLYHLGLASLCEQYAERAGQLKLKFGEGAEVKSAEEATTQWRRAAAEHYQRAFELAVTEDARLKHQPVSGIESLVSYEAGKGFLRVVEAMADRGADRQLMDRMDRHVRKIEKLPIGAITPIVFSLQPVDSLASLIEERAGASVAFDLDGTGREQRWTWVRAGSDVAILVWDPSGSGEIRSGRQLFGSVTWWMLPGDGYRAMDLLDDDRDGELSGAELRGLAVWFDRNGNGVSEPGEVTEVERLPIAAIGVRATSRDVNDGRTWMNPAGLRLTDGRVLPTWDWMAERR